MANRAGSHAALPDQPQRQFFGRRDDRLAAQHLRRRRETDLRHPEAATDQRPASGIHRHEGFALRQLLDLHPAAPDLPYQRTATETISRPFRRTTSRSTRTSPGPASAPMSSVPQINPALRGQQPEQLLARQQPQPDVSAGRQPGDRQGSAPAGVVHLRPDGKHDGEIRFAVQFGDHRRTRKQLRRTALPPRLL